MSTPNGYNIYLSLLHTTDPTLWQRLCTQHHEVISTQHHPTSKPPTPSPLTRARHATSALARFLLAAPSDPALKTHSNANARAFAASVPPVWLNPLAVMAFVGAGANVSVQWERSGGAKEKGIATQSTGTGIEERDFAHAQSRVPISSATGTKTHWIGTTLVPSTHAAHTDIRAVSSDVSAWPACDSQGNLFDSKTARLRGGACKKEKKKKKKKVKMSAWLKPLPEDGSVGDRVMASKFELLESLLVSIVGRT